MACYYECKIAPKRPICLQAACGPNTSTLIDHVGSLVNNTLSSRYRFLIHGMFLQYATVSPISVSF